MDNDEEIKWWYPLVGIPLLTAVFAPIACGIFWLIGAALTWAGVVA